MRTLRGRCLSSRARGTSNVRPALTGRDARAATRRSARGRKPGGRRRVVVLWLLCAVFSLTGATSADGRQTEVVDSNAVLNCGANSHPLAFAYHRTKIKGQEAEALSVILKADAPPNKVFSLYRYNLDSGRMKRDDDKGSAGQLDYDPGNLATYVGKFLRASFGKSFDEKRCADAGLIVPVLTSLSTSSNSLFDIVNGARPGAGQAEKPDSPFSVESSSEVEFSKAVFKFGGELGFGGDGPGSLSEAELIRQRDKAREALDKAQGELARAQASLGVAQTALGEATGRADARWWIILATLGYGLLATLALLTLLVRTRQERKLRPVLGQRGAELSCPGKIKGELVELVDDAYRESTLIGERLRKRNDPRLYVDELRHEHVRLAEQVETLFLSNGCEVPKELNDLLTGVKRQSYNLWHFVPVVGKTVNRVRDAVRLRKSKIYSAKYVVDNDFRILVKTIQDYADALDVKEDGKEAKEASTRKEAAEEATTHREPESDGHAANNGSAGALASTIKEAFTSELNPVLKQTVENAIKAEFSARSGEWIDLIRSSHSSRDVLDRLRAALPLVEPKRELSDAGIESHLAKLFSGVSEVCRLFATDKCTSADSLLREVKSLREEYQRFRERDKDVDSLPKLLSRIDARIDGFQKALSPVAAKDEDLLVCAGRIVEVHKNIKGSIEQSAAFKYLVERDGHKARLPLPECVSAVIELAGKVPQLGEENARHLTQIKELKTDRNNYRTQTETLTCEVTRLTEDVAGKEKQLGALETSAREFCGTYAETVNSFLRHLSFQPEEADPNGDVTSSLRTIRARADKAVHECVLFRSLRLRLLPGVEQLEREIAEVEGRGRGDVIRALSLTEEDGKLAIVENLRKIIWRLESFDGDNEKLWEHGLLDGFANGWLHHLLRADRLLQVYFADSSELTGLRNAVKGVTVSFEIAMRELGVRLFETKLLKPIPADRPVTRTKVGEITKVPEIKEAVETVRQNGSNFVVDIIHFGLGGRSGVNEEVRIAIMNPVDWA